MEYVPSCEHNVFNFSIRQQQRKERMQGRDGQRGVLTDHGEKGSLMYEGIDTVCYPRLDGWQNTPAFRDI